MATQKKTGTLWQFRTADPLGVNETLYHWANKAKNGGATWSRTKIVYPEGTDLQSADAHAIASITP